jgi:hypothetical protein
VERAAGFNRVRRVNRVDAARAEDCAMAKGGDAADAEREAVLPREAIAQLGDQPDETASDVAEANQREVEPREPVQTAAVSSSASSRRRPSVRIAGSAPNPIRRKPSMWKWSPGTSSTLCRSRSRVTSSVELMP